ncbi:hypothetical protein NUITMVS3_29070 [Shewanella xiamenensis]|nr:hypothetical protein NUITMVS2_19860 [Shewanella xiamenensis]GLD78475.1 hypothetical protein NUITMVS3_29070 [Shewanella xiamenensis]
MRSRQLFYGIVFNTRKLNGPIAGVSAQIDAFIKTNPRSFPLIHHIAVNRSCGSHLTPLRYAR